jgi:hypothetical protein
LRSVGKKQTTFFDFICQEHKIRPLFLHQEGWTDTPPAQAILREQAISREPSDA